MLRLPPKDPHGEDRGDATQGQAVAKGNGWLKGLLPPKPADPPPPASPRSRPGPGGRARLNELPDRLLITVKSSNISSNTSNGLSEKGSLHETSNVSSRSASSPSSAPTVAYVAGAAINNRRLEAEEGFTPLFNGKDTSGWTYSGERDNPRRARAIITPRRHPRL